MFCLVVEQGSISQAARASYISQPAVTRQIRQLEDHYGVLLFDRTNGKLHVSEAGELLYPYAKAIVDHFKRSEEAIEQFTGESEPHLRIGASLTIGEYLLPEILGLFKKEHPGIKVSLQIGNTPSMLEALINDDIHLALVEGAVEHETLDVKKFAEDELILVCSANHQWRDQEEITVHQLAEERMIWREEISGTRKIVENALHRHRILEQIENYMELGSTQAIKGAVEADLGVSILPKMSVERELKTHLLHEVNVREFEVKRDLWLVQKPQRFRNIGLDKFIHYIQNRDGL